MRPVLFLLLLVAAIAASDAPRTGAYRTTFAERHPESGLETMRARFGWTPQAKSASYDLASEEFDVHVPKDYDGSKPYGLIAYVNSGKGGAPPGQYRDLLAKHRLIWVGACKVENDRNVIPRLGLTLDAVWNMQKLYRIDARRIYASGTSGGGRVSSMLAPAYAEVFSGGIFLIGCNTPNFPVDRELGKRIRTLAEGDRYALMTGSKDFNQPGTREVEQHLKGLGFRHVHYFEEPGLAHSNPSAEWWEKGIMAIDQPLIDEAQTLLAKAEAAEAKKPEDACRLYRQITTEFPIARAAAERAGERIAVLAPAVDAELRMELGKLSTASAEKLRAFAVRAAGFPCEAEARAKAESQGDVELDAILAQPGATQPSRLEKHISAWQGFACAVRAGEAYDGLAAKALAPSEALATGKRAKPLAKFLKDWQDCPSRRKAQELLDAELTAEVEAILAMDKPSVRGGKLKAFLKAWPGTAAAARAEEELKKLLPPPPAK